MLMNNTERRTIRGYVPWYSDDYRISLVAPRPKADPCFMSPKDIYAEMLRTVVNQEEACRKISTMMYQHMHGHRFVGLIAGPTGSGKSFIAESLKRIYPDIVYIRDISNVTCDGWKGDKKVSTLFKDVLIPQSEHRPYPVLFLDECDKMFSPKITSAGENVSETVQAEFLSVIHGTRMSIPDGDGYTTVDTSKCSFLFAGAFEKTAESIAGSEPRLGFGASGGKAKAYDKELTMDDIHGAGCINELCGRIQRLVCLNPFGEGDYRKMLDMTGRGPVHELEEEFGMSIKISSDRKDAIAHTAYEKKLGIRGIKNILREEIDEIVWENCNAKVMEIA